MPLLEITIRAIKMTISKTCYAILGMLSINPMSGYDMQQLMKQSTANFWSESDGQLYPALTTLAREQLIKPVLKQKNDTRGKKTYQITALGKKALKAWLSVEPETKIVRDEFLLKLFFGANIDKKFILQHTEDYIYQAKNLLKKLKLTKIELHQETDNSPHSTYWELSLDYGIKMSEARIAWCNEVINKLTNK